MGFGSERRYSNWMEDLPDCLTLIPLNSLAIPGSHNSFSSQLDSSDGLAVDMSGSVKFLEKYVASLISRIVKKWSVTQRLTIVEQLERGVRYFDLRIAKKPSSEDFYFVHGLYGPLVIPVLEQIKSFLEIHKKEIVILDFNHFYNMNYESHMQLLHEIETVFRDLLITPSGRTEPGAATLRRLLQGTGRVYVFYHNVSVNRVSGVWPGCKIPSPWPDTNKCRELLRFHSNVYDKSRRAQSESFYVWQFVSTPRGSDIGRYLFGTLESTLASETSIVMVEWLKSKLAGPSSINICMSDFVEKNNFIPTVIEMNDRTFVKNSKTA